MILKRCHRLLAHRTVHYTARNRTAPSPLVLPPRPRNDQLHAPGLPARESPPREVVPDHVAEGQSEDRQGRHAARPRAPHAHVQLPRVQGYEGRVQAIRVAVLCVRDQPGRQRARDAGDHPPICRGAGSVLWERLRVGLDLQLPEGVCYPRRAHHCGGTTRVVKEVGTASGHTSGQYRRAGEQRRYHGTVGQSRLKRTIESPSFCLCTRTLVYTDFQDSPRQRVQTKGQSRG